jgi:transposase
MSEMPVLGAPMLTPEQVAEHLAVSRDVVYDLVQQGRLVGVRLNPMVDSRGRQRGTVRFRLEDVQAFIESGTTELRGPRLVDELPRRKNVARRSAPRRTA